jgi:D-inositol-3-phosphate glycosyltransferase
MDKKKRIALLTGGNMTHYAVLVANAVGKAGTEVSVVASSEIRSYSLNPNVRVLPFRRSVDPKRSMLQKILDIINYYYQLVTFLLFTDIRIFHFFYFRYYFMEGILCNALIKLRGRQLIYEVHNVWPHNKRGNKYIYVCQKFAYQICDVLICHNKSSSDDLVHDFSISREKIRIIPIGLLSHIPKSDLSRKDARRMLLPLERMDCPVLLFFGKISPYKGIEFLIKACQILYRKTDFYLIIAGDKSGAVTYWEIIRNLIEESLPQTSYCLRPFYIPDEEMEIYFKAADVVIIPYLEIYQSFIHMQAFYFGKPVIATDIGSFREDIPEGHMGYVVPPGDPESLARAIDTFLTEMLPNSAHVFEFIQKEAAQKFSWDASAKSYISLYEFE